MIRILPKGKKAWVTFSYKPEIDVLSVEIAGDWNGWEPEKMKKKKDGTFYLRKFLEIGQNYQFRYLIDDTSWVNDTQARKLQNPFGSENSLVELEGVIAE